MLLLTLALVPGGIVALGAIWFYKHCSHKFSWPRGKVDGKGVSVICMKCAKEFEYDWKKMRVGKEISHDRDSAHTSGPGAWRLVSSMDKAKE